TPVFSPDSQWVAFFDGPALRKVPVSGGPAVTICVTEGAGAFGASWGDDGSIVFALARPESSSKPAGLMVGPASGGEPKALTTVAPGTGEMHVYPVVLPQSRGVLFTVQTAGRVASGRQLIVLDRVSGERRELAPAAAGADYVPGRVIYADVQGNL